MMEDKDDWLKGLQNKMKDYEDPAPEGLWEDIESSVFPEKRHRVIAMPILWRSVTAAAVVALGVFAGLRLSDSFMEEPLDKAQETLASGQPSSVNSSGGQESSVELVRKPESETLLADSGSVTKRQGQASDVNNVKSALVTGMVVPEDEEKGVDAQSYVTEETLHGVASHARPQAKRPEEMTSEIEKSESGEEKSPVSISMDHEGEDWSNYISATDDLRTSRRNAATLDVAFSGGAMDSRDEILYDLQMFYRGSAPASTNGLITDSGNNFGDDSQIQSRGLAPMNTKADASTVITRSEHKRPVRVALTANYPLSRTFGIETGVAYTTLRSTFTNEAGNTVSRTEQTLRYLGVPLNVSALLLDSKWVSLYAMCGGMVEKCLSGKSVTASMLSGVKQGDDAKNDVDIDQLLWSLNASAGLQVKLTKHLGLYVEPGLSYHFDDRSNVQTIYKERPLDFMLTFGARFSFR